MGGDRSQLSPLSRHSQGPDVALAPGRPSLWPKALARLGWCSGLQELVVSPQDGDPWSLAAGRQLPPLQETGAGRGYLRGGGRGVSWRRWRNRRCWHPHRISPPGRSWRRRGLPRTAGGPRATWGAGGGVSCWPLPGPTGSGGAGVPKPGSDSRAKGACPTPAAAHGSRALLRGEHICRGCREQRNLPPAPPEERRGRSLIPRFGASVSGSRGHLGAHRTPSPPRTSQTGTSPAKGCGLAKVAGKARPRRPAPPPSPVPGPRRVALTMLAPLRAPRALQFPRADSNPPSRHRLRARLRGGPERPAGRRRGKRGRAGGRTPEPDWRGRDARSAALARLAQRRRENPA